MWHAGGTAGENERGTDLSAAVQLTWKGEARPRRLLASRQAAGGGAAAAELSVPPRAWEALSDRTYMIRSAGELCRSVTTGDHRRPLRTTAWGTSRARPVRTTGPQTSRLRYHLARGARPVLGDHLPRWQAPRGRAADLRRGRPPHRRPRRTAAWPGQGGAGSAAGSRRRPGFERVEHHHTAVSRPPRRAFACTTRGTRRSGRRRRSGAGTGCRTP
jgi:hypothetical protein